MLWLLIMHQSFVSPAPLGQGNSGAFNFSIFKAPVKAWPCGVRFVVGKIPAKSPGSPEGDNNVEQHLGVVLVKLKLWDMGLNFFMYITGSFAN